MTKLHELLAVEGDREQVAKHVQSEAMETFSKRHDHFIGHTKTTTFFDENRQQENTREEKALVTTVDDKLSHVRKHVSAYLDVFGQKEWSNTGAKADLIVDGHVLLSNVPATLLLGLESRLKTLRAVYQNIPTLAPGVPWELDTSQGSGVFVNPTADARFKTEKQLKWEVMVPATDKHPAQVEKWAADVPIARVEQQNWSGMWTPAKKAAVLARIDNLVGAVKQARQRANEAEVIGQKISDVLFTYIASE